MVVCHCNVSKEFYLVVEFSRSQNPYSQPIWVSNQLANDSSNRRSGVIAWPGSNTPINGYRPFKFEDYDENRSLPSSIREMLQWFQPSGSNPINFGAIYHPEPDATGKLSIDSILPMID